MRLALLSLVVAVSLAIGACSDEGSVTGRESERAAAAIGSGPWRYATTPARPTHSSGMGGPRSTPG
jgi:hypothetical protein